MHSVTRYVIILLGGILFFSCRQKPPAANPPVPVNLFTVKSEMVRYYDTYPSTAQALSQVNIVPSVVQGYVTGIFAADGAQVRKGQLLYEIDKRIYQAAYDQALANLKVAQSNQLQQQQDADRYVYLNKYNAVAKQLYDHAMIALETAKSQTKVAQEAVKSAQTNLNFASVYAPFDGTIGISAVRLGNVVVGGQTIMNTISTNDPMAVDFLVNEKQLLAFERFKTDSSAMPDSLFTLQLPDNTGYPYPGKISVIDRAVDPQTGTIRMRLVFPNHQHLLKVGMSCVVRVRNQEKGPQMVVPNKAVVEQMGEYFLFVAKDTVVASKNKPGKEEVSRLHAYQKKIQIGQTIGADVIVLSGVTDGDRVVVDGIQSIHDGSAITLAAKKPHTGADSGKTNK
ncbi:efflux RND transporter periplasmic adaptor subunit [Chitinophaga qingshengii]|uniref:Efflux RND transporter periplasmic adaptor subunit n=1 Tax=Chitinophaga qingshengii TaxID=1569794 RepID=A0ABR7TRC3_9BACT|nr:efflux RND transporter periplasmic adaptor subunit [Chitinophaga qingshengii]MBC9933051.1 efflux RND transporter periplasmic adaptor subunit [Chitinophaga qingshengii]